MNLFKKIAVSIVGIAMAVGVGVAVGNSNKTAVVKAGAVEQQIYSEDFTDWTADQSYNSDDTTKPSDAGVTNKWTTNHAGIASSGITGNTMKVRAYKKSGTHEGYFYTNFSLTSVTKVSFDVKAGNKDLNQGYNIYYKTTSNGSWTSFGSATYSNTTLHSVEHTISATGEYDNVWLKVVLSSDVNTNQSSNYDISFDNLIVYGMVEQSGAITGVVINDVSEHAINITSGYLLRKQVQLSATVSQSGSGLSTDVTWSSADSTKMAVDENGLVTIKANDTVRITATSDADDDFSDYVDITASGLLTFTGTTTSTNFDTTDMGSNNITSTSKGSAVSIAGTMTEVSVFADKDDSTNSPGFYTSSPVSVRMYIDSIMTISAPLGYKLFWVDFTSLESNPMTTSNTSVSVGSGTIETNGTSAVIDCTANAVNSITLSFSVQVRLSAMSVSYGEDIISSVVVDISEATNTSFVKDTTFTSSTASSSNIFAYANYAGGSIVDVTSAATWNLDTSTIGTKSLSATYGGKTSSGVNVTIINSAVAATGVTISPAEPEVYVGNTVQLTATVTPNDATDKTVTWSSDDESIATVDENGLVTGVAAGSTYINVSANGGVNVEDIVEITVNEKTYINKITSVSDLWDGQQVYLIDATASYAALAYSSGNYVTSEEATLTNAGAKFSVTDITSAYAYNVGRFYDSESDEIQYTFSYISDDTTYYLYCASTSTNGYLKGKTTLDDLCYWTISISNGQATIENVGARDLETPLTRRYMYFNASTHGLNSLTTGNKVSFYAVTEYDENTVADAFVDDYMHMDANVSGQCNTYYPIAKRVWNAMSDDERLNVSVNHDDAYDRLEAWAAAHSDHLDGDMNIVSNLRTSSVGTIIKNNSTSIVFVVISVLSITATGAFLFLKKRKEI